MHSQSRNFWNGLRIKCLVELVHLATSYTVCGLHKVCYRDQLSSAHDIQSLSKNSLMFEFLGFLVQLKLPSVIFSKTFVLRKELAKNSMNLVAGNTNSFNFIEDNMDS